VPNLCQPFSASLRFCVKIFAVNALKFLPDNLVETREALTD
jgi:hypothetical protein